MISREHPDFFDPVTEDITGLSTVVPPGKRK